jgi:hypothetical protein
MQRLKRLGLLSSVSTSNDGAGRRSTTEAAGLTVQRVTADGEGRKADEGVWADRRGGYGTGVCVKKSG